MEMWRCHLGAFVGDLRFAWLKHVQSFDTNLILKLHFKFHLLDKTKMKTGTSRGRGTREMWLPSGCHNSKRGMHLYFEFQVLNTKLLDIPISLAMTQLGQVRVDLEDPVALATFLVTANIKLIRAEWLGDAPDAISGDTAAGQLFEKVDHFSNFGNSMSI